MEVRRAVSLKDLSVNALLLIPVLIENFHVTRSE